jgi:1,3-beta-galactosyl-N-acetylhexosamine phosphorylase
MGVDKEIGLSVMTAAVKFEPLTQHFITDDRFTTFDFGIENSYVFCCDEKTQVLKTDSGGLHIHLSVNEFGKGRSAFMAGLPYSRENSRLLLRTLFWLARKETELKKWFTSNLNTDCAAFPDTGYAIVVNNVDSPQTTQVYDSKGNPKDFTLEPYKCEWFKI